MATLGAGGALAAVGRTSMMKWAIWAGWVLLGASGGGVPVVVAVGALSVRVCFDCFLDFDFF